MGLLTTNEALAGVTAVIGVTNLAAAIWLTYSFRRQVKRTRERSAKPYSTIDLILRRDAIRITFGFIIKTLAIAVIFLMRLPLRANDRLCNPESTHTQDMQSDACLSST